MKKTLLDILCGLLVAALLISAVCIGAVRGWQGERERTLAALSTDGELYALLEARAMDASNLLVVVSRHLDAGDERLARLRSVRDILADPAAHADEVVSADAELTALAEELGRALPELDSVQASPRDQAYISTLTRALTEPSTVSQRYADLALGFNSRLVSSPTGWIARWFGVALIEAE